MARKKKEDIKEEEVKTTILPALEKPSYRDDKGHFVKGHPQLGHAQKGSRWKYSGEIRDKISTTLLAEMGSDKFSQGLEQLFFDDRRAYFQVLCMMAKIVVPTNIELEASVQHKTLVDERLAILVGKKTANVDE